MTKAADKRAKRQARVDAVQAENASRGPGRPSEYDPAFCEVVIAAGREGKSRAEIAAELDCTRETLNEWAKAHPEFSDALNRAKEFELAWWEGKARVGVDKGGQVNAALWSRSVSGRFPAEPYRERTELSGPGGGPIQTQPLADELAALPKAQRDQLREAIKGVIGK
jgi:hypothetical protein